MSADRINRDFYEPAARHEITEPEVGTLGTMLIQTVKELAELPQTRTEKDPPEEIRYLRNPTEGILIMIARRRPRALSDSERTHRYGYFAEAYQEIDGLPHQQVRGASNIWTGTYIPVEISGKISPSLGIPSNSSLDTQQKEMVLKSLRDEVSSKAVEILNGTGGEILEENIVTNFLAAGSSHEQELKSLAEKLQTASSRESHIPTQGFTANVEVENLIISDGEDPLGIFPLTSELGIRTNPIHLWEATADIDPYVRHVIRKSEDPYKFFPADLVDGRTSDPKVFERFLQHNNYPLIVTIDSNSLKNAVHPRDFEGARRMLTGYIEGESSRHPLFAVVEIFDDGREEGPAIERKSAGNYLFRGGNPSDLRGLYLKIGVDYALTRQIRGLASLVASL